MSKIILKEELMSFPPAFLERWRNGDYSLLTSGNIPSYIKQIIVYKAKVRPGRRFFGEAFVAVSFSSKNKDGFYCSYKWMTVKKWINGKGLKPEFEKPFYDGLHKYIGTENLKEIQKRSNKYRESHDGNKPVASDLILIGNNGRLMFLEVKLPGDTIRPNQIPGLAILQSFEPLNADVSIISLYPENATPPKPKEYSVELD